jgi:hypothetical protein
MWDKAHRPLFIRGYKTHNSIVYQCGTKNFKAFSTILHLDLNSTETKSPNIALLF